MRQYQESAKGEKSITISCDHKKGCTKKATFPLSQEGKNWTILATKKGWYVTGRMELCSTHVARVQE